MQRAYWLWVMKGRGLPDSVRAVGLDESAEPWEREAADRLARELSVLVEPGASPFPDAPRPSPEAPAAGFAFEHSADPRLDAPFDRGRREGI